MDGLLYHILTYPTIEKVSNTIIGNTLVFSMDDYICVKQSSHDLGPLSI